MKIRILIFFLSLALAELTFTHPGHGSGRRPLIKGAGKGSIRELHLQHDDTSNVTLDFYNYSSFGWAPNWNVMEPLGTGGMPGEDLNSELKNEHTVDFLTSGSLQKRRMQTEFTDFGFIPIWQPDNALIQLRFRILPTLTSTLSLEHLGGFDQLGDQAESGGFSLGELNLKWSPGMLPGFEMDMGRLNNFSGFVGLFAIAPIENYELNGVKLKYGSEFGLFSAYEIHLVGGTQFKGYSVVHSPFLSPDHPGFFETTRQKTHVYGQGIYKYKDAYNIRLLGGYQFSPGDTSQTKAGVENFIVNQIFEEAKGWHLGWEFNFFGKSIQHTLLIAHGQDDVQMGWGSPFFVAYDRNSKLDPTYYSRKGSMLTNYLYWGNIENLRNRIEGGIWLMDKRNARNRRSNEINDNLVVYTDFLDRDLDSVLIKEGIITSPTIDFDTEDFRALKFALQPSVKYWDLVRFGFRYDAIFYLTPNAHSNTQEVLYDNFLNPNIHERVPGFAISGQSKWELEPVDAHIVSPWVALEFGENARIDFTYSMGMYDREVMRHGERGKFHSNYNVGLQYYYRFAK